MQLLIRYILRLRKNALRVDPNVHGNGSYRTTRAEYEALGVQVKSKLVWFIRMTLLSINDIQPVNPGDVLVVSKQTCSLFGIFAKAPEETIE